VARSNRISQIRTPFHVFIYRYHNDDDAKNDVGYVVNVFERSGTYRPLSEPLVAS
jgi:hypothetical protein